MLTWISGTTICAFIISLNSPDKLLKRSLVANLLPLAEIHDVSVFRVFPRGTRFYYLGVQLCLLKGWCCLTPSLENDMYYTIHFHYNDRKMSVNA